MTREETLKYFPPKEYESLPFVLPSGLSEAQLLETEGLYHGRIQVGHLTAIGLISGCGIMQLTGNMYLCNVNFEAESINFENLKAKISKKELSNPCRTLIATFGNTFYSKECYPLFLKLGFKLLIEYQNAAHPYSPKDTQRLFILTW